MNEVIKKAAIEVKESHFSSVALFKAGLSESARIYTLDGIDIDVSANKIQAEMLEYINSVIAGVLVFESVSVFKDSLAIKLNDAFSREIMKYYDESAEMSVEGIVRVVEATDISNVRWLALTASGGRFGRGLLDEQAAMFVGLFKERLMRLAMKAQSEGVKVTVGEINTISYMELAVPAISAEVGLNFGQDAGVFCGLLQSAALVLMVTAAKAGMKVKPEDFISAASKAMQVALDNSDVSKDNVEKYVERMLDYLQETTGEEFSLSSSIELAESIPEPLYAGKETGELGDVYNKLTSDTKAKMFRGLMIDRTNGKGQTLRSFLKIITSSVNWA